MKSLAELQAIRDKMRQQIDLRDSGDDRIRVVVGMATCGIAAGARPVLNAFLEEVAKRELKNVTVSQTGCIGVCRLEPDLVRTLLTNLIDNARKAMDQPGCIRVRGEVTREGCRFTVQDNGRGIAAEELAHISEPFYRVDKSRSRAQGGAGLGLALCSEIVRLHKGEMSFSSAVGQGTCVTVELRGGAVCVSCDA